VASETLPQIAAVPMGSILTLFGGIIIGLALIVAFIAPLKSKRRPVTFKTLDEEAAVSVVAWWAAQQLNIKSDDPQLLYSLQPWIYPWFLNWEGRIPIKELALLAPFIDLAINGKLPPLNQPADQEDWRPAALAAFKKRMQAEGLWPS
jgi:hypothetical protein